MDKENIDVPSNIATEAEYGVVKMANVNELYDGTESEGFAPSPFSFKNTVAKEDNYGTVRISTLSEMREGKLYQGSAISPLNLSKYTATKTELGIVKLAHDDISQASSTDVLTTVHYKHLGDKLDELSKRESGDKIPIGIIGMFPKDNIPLGWLIADGSTYIKSVYKQLSDYLGSEYSVSATYFKVPDYSGYFLRGYDPTGKVDPDGKKRSVGAIQRDAMQHLTGGFATDDEGRGYINGCFYNNGWANGPGKTGAGTNVRFDNARQARVSTENRPTNKSVVICIRAFGDTTNGGTVDITKLIEGYNDLNKRVINLENKSRNNFNRNENGFWYDANSDFKIKWGWVNRSGNVTNVKFPQPFDDVCLNVSLTQYTSGVSDSGNNISVSSFNKNGFVLQALRQEYKVMWVAIGR